jgi:uncharacterized protein (DUF486 family)
MTWERLAPIVLLSISNIFMTFAWYGQLRFPNASIWLIIPASWGIAFFEYCFVVPANHFGARVYTAPQLKTIQEVITLLIFAGFSPLYLGQPLKWNHAVAFVFLVLAAYFGLKKF